MIIPFPTLHIVLLYRIKKKKKNTKELLLYAYPLFSLFFFYHRVPPIYGESCVEFSWTGSKRRNPQETKYKFKNSRI